MVKIELEFFSVALKKNARCIVLLPSLSPQEYLDGENNSYLNDSVKFKTLYLLHGSYGGYNDWPLNTNITTYIEKYNLAVVMPDGENSGYNNTSSGDFLKYISKELPNYLETMFPLYSSKENRFIAGLSMGGYGAAYIALKNPTVFSFCAVLSGCVDFYKILYGNTSYADKMSDNYKRQFDSYIENGCNLYSAMELNIKENNKDVKFFFTSGDNDLFVDEIMEFANKLEENGYNVKKQIAPGVHDWIYWNEHIKDALKFFPLID